jgi:hypothetical protein
MTAIRIRTYSVVLPINQQVAPEAAEPASALDDNVIADANASRLGESSGHLVHTDTSRGEPVKSERIPARSPQTSPIFAQKISGLFLPRKRGEPPALTMLRATPFPAPASHRKRPRDKKGAPKRTLGRIESHRPRLTRPHVAKKSPASAPLATITGCASRPATMTGANGSLSLTDARWAPTRRSASARSTSETISTEPTPAAASDTARAARAAREWRRRHPAGAGTASGDPAP